mmetsp:Transcript_25539/g.71565  ORF Transcript_25539/g.71565 Transcript_25539/m.71565 type:complete len:210 (-) Transcript_25539:1287-1916(-)
MKSGWLVVAVVVSCLVAEILAGTYDDECKCMEYDTPPDCPFHCNPCNVNAVAECGCWCNQMADIWGTDDVVMTYAPSYGTSPGQCKCCQGSRRRGEEPPPLDMELAEKYLNGEPDEEQRELLIYGQSTLARGEDLGPIFIPYATCQSNYAGNTNTCDSSCYATCDSLSAIDCEPHFYQSQYLCKCCTVVDPCEMTLPVYVPSTGCSCTL